jgi:transcriptional regulator NrdR family protein
MASLPDKTEPSGSRALRSAEAALSRIQRSVHAAQAGEITASEAVEQILDELAARPALNHVRAALSRSFSPTQPH